MTNSVTFDTEGCFGATERTKITSQRNRIQWSVSNNTSSCSGAFRVDQIQTDWGQPKKSRQNALPNFNLFSTLP